ncbi:anti-sigma factor family protein [Actinomycetospora sp. CA-101289]|uniref:anti-sigma factor family protein n=1 Tax=Actinomycetospora sp. CA-101289 TaxID=3239893 RepID=UPI003D99DFDD
MISGSPGGSGWTRRFTEAGHLALDAVVAFVDDELPPGPAHRAAAHVDRCLSCAGEVAAQRQARRRVQSAECPAVPSALLRALRSIPDAASLPSAPAGLSVGPDGSLVVPVDGGEIAADAAPARARRGRRRAFGLPVAVGSGVVVGAAALVAFTGPAVVADGTGSGLPAGAAVRPTTTAPADLTAGVTDTARTGPGLRGPGAP